MLRDSTLLAIAPEKVKQQNDTAPNQAKSDKAAPQQQPDDKTQVAVYLTAARLAFRTDSPDLWNTLNRGLDFAEEIFQKAKKEKPLQVGYSNRGDEWQGPGYMAPGFDEANALIKLGMEKETANTLGWLAKEHDPALKSYLLISAADGLWNKQKNSGAERVPSSQERIVTTAQ